MGICPNCGSWVDEGDICMSCGGGGGRRIDDDYDNCSSGNYQRNYISGSDIKARNRIGLEFKKKMYESKLKEAREEKYYDRKVKIYGEALDYANSYSRDSEIYGIEIDGMPDRRNIFSKEDIDWISKSHYNESTMLHIISTDRTENLEKLLKESGNSHIIAQNEETRRIKAMEKERRRQILHVKYLRKDYFESINEANEFVLNDKAKKAMKKYRRAVSDHEEYFNSNYKTDEKSDKMPEEALTPDAVDHIMILYKKTHPRLTSKKSNLKINQEIIDLLDGKWDDRLSDADGEVDEIIRKKELERQKRKEKVEEVAVDVIVGARIARDMIWERFRK